MNQFNGGHIILPSPELSTCDLCGDTYPVRPGDHVRTCREWVDLTLNRMPKPMSFDTLLNLKMFAKLCNLTRYIKSGIEVLSEVEGRG